MRSLVLFVLLALGGYFGMGQAHASCSPGSGYNQCDSREQAYSVALLDAQQNVATMNCMYDGGPGTPTVGTGTATDSYRGFYGCATNPTAAITGNYHWLSECPTGKVWNNTTHTCDEPVDCSTKPPLGESWIEGDVTSMTGPTSACSDGCAYFPPASMTSATLITIDGVTWTKSTGWEAAGGTCTAGPATPDTSSPPSDADGDGVSDGQDGDPDNPGQGENPPDPPPDDPACGTAGHPECSETPDGENKSSGGGDCKTPPSSSGDPILAQIAFQTWATRCAITGNANSSGDGDGEATTLDLAATNGKLDGIKGAIDGLTDLSGTTHDGTGEDAEGTVGEINGTVGATGFDQSGFGYSRSCPAPVEAEVYGQTITLSSPVLCDWMIAGGYFVLLLAGLGCARIIASA